MKLQILDGEIGIDESIIAESAAEIRAQVREYERGDRRRFDLDVTVPDGLTGDVMAAMMTIPYGETRTYGDLAADLGTSPVAVGQACGRNPVPVVVPCHRVVGSDGALTGYSAADGVATKRRLLELEARESGGPVQMRLPTK
ncbi:methylated-DNA--[protein]-cysteine S-methyltransferase [Natrialba asiatica]|uniref:methylated-DNA--[protein]-cysteine S-methyltransferase n=1 Tax=Natrialba asiatica (strain ATCC 700177 / DSM 12278 / JCM 9576 / FERM P-10747 / NBRC 102637 / 172P1) TaxID=29540 RepID=M0AP25_NATA1|nr:methylated-DNA--[protein]-cysteine S-methyltransferase [Natrialba asiatica]ELZ00062.1 methylated-DNA--protein-cysteine methyltransferase [Natrialba asiatica DSM 12278]